MNTDNLGLGRLPAPDSRDARFPMRAAFAAEPSPRTHRYWNLGPWKGNQGRTSQCVDYSLLHWLQAGPVVHRKPNSQPWFEPGYIYQKAQQVDEWPGEDYDGTSVRAGAKVLQSEGLISSYHWGFNLDDVVDCLLTTGPVVMGTNWYTGMFKPNSKGLVEPTGVDEGGHAWTAYGANRKTRTAVCLNSWGVGWGLSGRFRMSFDTLGMLIAENGEAMLATEAA